MTNEIKLPINLAVYGTLKRGYGNHKLLGNSEFMGTFLLPNMECYMGRSFPMAWYNKDSKKALKCEIYRIEDQKILDQLHALEGHPNFFRCIKHPKPIILNSCGDDTSAWFYQCEEASYGTTDHIMEWKQ